MPVLGATVKPREGGPASANRVNANNQVDVPLGWQRGVLIDWFIFEIKEGHAKGSEKVGDQKFAIKVALYGRDGLPVCDARSGDPAVLVRRGAAYLSAKSQMAQIVESLTSLPAGSDAQKAWDTDEAIPMFVEVQLVRNGDYVNVNAFKPCDPFPVRGGPAAALVQSPSPAVAAPQTATPPQDEPHTLAEGRPMVRRNRSATAAANGPTEADLARARESVPPAQLDAGEPTRAQAAWIERFRERFGVQVPDAHVARFVMQISTATGEPTEAWQDLTSAEAFALCGRLCEHMDAVFTAARLANGGAAAAAPVRRTAAPPNAAPATDGPDPFARLDEAHLKQAKAIVRGILGADPDTPAGRSAALRITRDLRQSGQIENEDLAAFKERAKQAKAA